MNKNDALIPLSHSQSIQENFMNLPVEQRRNLFYVLARHDAEELFLNLSAPDQKDIFQVMTLPEQRSWLRLLAPDDAADLIQTFPENKRLELIELLDYDSQQDVLALLAYAEDNAGGLMNPRFIRLRPDVTVDVAIRYLRAQARGPIEMIHYAYVLDNEQRLLGTVSFRDLLLSLPNKLVSEIMAKELIVIHENLDQEEVSREFSRHALPALPVLDAEGHMKGIVTIDDAVDVVEEEATEDMHKIGGLQALTAPYFKVHFLEMIKKRGGWLTVLFISEMFTATAMGFFEKEIEKAVVLALFIPLIISSGGNSGSQASTLIIRAMALGEVKLRDWVRVFGRELLTGLTLGCILGSIGFLRILLWPGRTSLYGEHYLLLGCTVSFSLVGVVLWGTLTGSMLPFILRRCNIDPATASAPFVATLVDVTGIVIYFSVASLFLKGIIL